MGRDQGVGERHRERAAAQPVPSRPSDRTSSAEPPGTLRSNAMFPGSGPTFRRPPIKGRAHVPVGVSHRLRARGGAAVLPEPRVEPQRSVAVLWQGAWLAPLGSELLPAVHHGHVHAPMCPRQASTAGTGCGSCWGCSWTTTSTSKPLRTGRKCPATRVPNGYDSLGRIHAARRHEAPGDTSCPFDCGRFGTPGGPQDPAHRLARRPAYRVCPALGPPRGRTPSALSPSLSDRMQDREGAAAEPRADTRSTSLPVEGPAARHSDGPRALRQGAGAHRRTAERASAVGWRTSARRVAGVSRATHPPINAPSTTAAGALTGHRPHGTRSPRRVGSPPAPGWREGATQATHVPCQGVIAVASRPHRRG